jgi:hypothetical protein
MSILAYNTDFKAWQIISKCLKQLDEINSLHLKVTKIDDFESALQEIRSKVLLITMGR